VNSPHSACYQETHSALNGPLLAYGLFPPVAAAAAGVLGAEAALPWMFDFTGAFIAVTLICTTVLSRNWPTGIRIDGSAISIGAVGSARAARRNPGINQQARGLYTCPLAAVQGIRVVTDRAELRQMKNSPRYYTFTNRWGGKRGMSHCHIGVLASPFMRAALVIDVDPFAVTATDIRPARYYSNFKDGRFSHLIHPQLSATWIVPTRHPEALSAALQGVPGNHGSVRRQ
jgi:hypothetical protein